MNNSELIKKQREEQIFKEEVISPLVDKVLGEIMSRKLSYKQAEILLKEIDRRIKETIIGS